MADPPEKKDAEPKIPAITQVLDDALPLPQSVDQTAQRLQEEAGSIASQVKGVIEGECTSPQEVSETSEKFEISGG